MSSWHDFLEYPHTQHNAFTSAICSGVEHVMDISSGFATNKAKLLARDRATLSRFVLYRKSMNLGRDSSLDVVMETMTTSACCP